MTENRINTVVDTHTRHGAQFFYIFNTPKNKSNWIFPFIEKHRIKKSTIIHTTIYDMLDDAHQFIKPDVLIEAESVKRVDEQRWRHDYLGEAVGTDGLAFPRFNDKHIIKKIPDDENIISWVVGIDTGTMDATVFGLYGISHLGKLYKTNQYYHSGRAANNLKSPSEYVADFKVWLANVKAENKINLIDKIVIDPSSLAFRQELRANGFIVKSGDNSRPEGYQRMLNLVNADAFFILDKPENTLTIAQLQNAETESIYVNGSQQEVIKRVNNDIINDIYQIHTLDEWKYVLSQVKRILQLK